MRTAGLPNFRKLFGKINQDLAKGTYSVTVSVNSFGKTLYDVSSFSGAKGFVLGKASTGDFDLSWQGETMINAATGAPDGPRSGISPTTAGKTVPSERRKACRSAPSPKSARRRTRPM